MNWLVKVIENFLFMIALFIMICALVCQITGVKPVVVMSGSMEPAIETGSLAFIDTRETEFSKGDVISFYAGELMVTHRVVEITEQGYKTKGDNNDNADAGIVQRSQIEGKILFSIPELGYILKAVALPTGFAAILLYLIMKVIYRGKNNDKNRKEKSSNCSSTDCDDGSNGNRSVFYFD